jgi:hypothetical protein
MQRAPDSPACLERAGRGSYDRSESKRRRGTDPDLESLPIIPRELEDILTIKASERHRWLKAGRLPSAGTRTVSAFRSIQLSC